MAARAGRWSDEQIALRALLDDEGPFWDDWTDRNVARTCRVCRESFRPVTGRKGPTSPWCSQRCRDVWIAWAAEQHRLGRYWNNSECRWCFHPIIKRDGQRKHPKRFCSRHCYSAARNHLTSNPELDRCEVPKCPDCGLVGCVSRKTRRPDRSSTRRPRGRCRECHRRWTREYELNRPIGPVRDRQRWRNRVIAAGDKISPAEVIQRFGNVCYLCDREIDVMIDDPNDPGYLNIDHIIPIRRGGQHLWDNVAPTHRKCNMSKGAKLVAPPVGWKGTWTP